MAQLKKKTKSKIMLPKYEMAKRKEDWKSKNAIMEKELMTPLEAQPLFLQELMTLSCYNQLCKILNLPSLPTSLESHTSSVDTMIPFLPTDEGSLEPKSRKSTVQETKFPRPSTASLSESISSSESDYEYASLPEAVKVSQAKLSSAKTETASSSDWYSRAKSDIVEVEKKVPYKEELILRHKAVLKFLELPEEEVATWRKKEKHIKKLNEMTLEEKGEFLIDKVAVEFCDWMRNLGGDEKSSISEEVLKELFQIGMDNPATRGVCVKMQENKVLYYKLAEFLNVPEKSFPEVLSHHLNWDAKVEKTKSKLVAFGKHLPKDLYFKTPKNKTSETWLEWNKLSKEELTFADVYDSIQNLQSTQEYCKWMLNHPEHKKPLHLVNIGMFERMARGTEESRTRTTLRFSVESDMRKSTLSTTVPARTLIGSNIGQTFWQKDKPKIKITRSAIDSQV